MKVLSVYTDTSVFGGVFDLEFEVPSRSFFDLVCDGRFSLLVSDVTRQELAFSPSRVQAHFDEMLSFMTLVPVDEQVLALRDAYISAAIVGARWADDAHDRSKCHKARKLFFWNDLARRCSGRAENR